jgi:pseudouridylate synthase
MPLVIVDAENVRRSVWPNLSPEELVARARAWAAREGHDLLIVFDGPAPDEPLDDVEPLIVDALRAARADDVSGQAVTPFVLSYLHHESGGRTLQANKDLIAQNARLAGEIAAAAGS